MDEILYDGQNFITNKYGQIFFKAKEFEEDFPITEIELGGSILENIVNYELDWR